MLFSISNSFSKSYFDFFKFFTIYGTFVIKYSENSVSKEKKEHEKTDITWFSICIVSIIC